MVKSSITDQYGRPMELARLSQEIATPTSVGVRRTIEDAVATGMTPERLAAVLRDAAHGYSRAYLTLAEEIEERYLHYASQLQTRRLAIEGVEISLDTPAGVPAKIVDAVKALIEDSQLEEMCGALTDAVGKGYSAVEMMWEYEGGYLRPAEYKWRDPRFFQFDWLSLTELRLAVDSHFDGEDLPPAKFLCHMPRTKMGIPLRRGLARPAAWAYLIQAFGLKDWAAFAEVYGVPFRLGKYHASASEDDRRTLLRAVRAISSDAAAIVPQGMEIEFHPVEGQHGAAIFGELIDYVDKQVSKLVVGQTMTADDGASMAQAKVHNEVRLDILAADCRQLAQTLNRDLIEPFVAMNFGPQAVYPKVQFPVAEPEDVEALAASVAQLVPLGLRVSQHQLREKLGLSEPTKDDELLSPPAATPMVITPAERQRRQRTERRAAAAAHGAACACPSCRGPASLAGELGEADDGVGEVEALAAEILADWEEITDPLLGPLRAVLAEASSFEEALAMLEARGPDGTRLVEALARATAISRGVGDVMD